MLVLYWHHTRTLSRSISFTTPVSIQSHGNNYKLFWEHFVQISPIAIIAIVHHL